MRNAVIRDEKRRLIALDQRLIELGDIQNEASRTNRKIGAQFASVWGGQGEKKMKSGGQAEKRTTFIDFVEDWAWQKRRTSHRQLQSCTDEDYYETDGGTGVDGKLRGA